ncbi:MAG: FAD-dependent oxidoreductase [Caulobacteraceae bacterium]
MGRPFQSPLTRLLRQAQAACAESAALGAPIGEVTEQRALRRSSMLGRCHGNIDSFLKGAYSFVPVSTEFSGVERLPAGNLHFGGEHTCVEYQGYMEGAVRSGERAATEI